MKKLLFTLCALCLCGTMWADETGTVYKDVNTGLYFAEVTYSVNSVTALAIVAVPDGEDASYSIDNLVKNDDGTYTLPATVQAEGGEEQTLTGVGASALAETLTDTTNPIHLVIPANVNYIGQSAFQKCTQIGEVTVEYSETALDEAHNVTYGNSFSGCSNLKVVTQNRNITIHRNNNQYSYICFPFADLPSIETVYIGEKVTALANNAYNARANTTKLTKVYCYATAIPSLDYQCFLYLADGCTLYVYDELVEDFKSDSQYNSEYNLYHGWGDIFSTITGMGEEPEEEQPEGTLRDVTTGLYFEIDADGVVSIVADASGVYTDDNLLYDEEGGYYTFPETVTDKSGTSGSVTRIGESAFNGSNISGHIYIPAFITALGTKAFYGVTTITEVTLEYSETALKEENNALYTTSFYGCSNLQTVHMNREVSLARGDNDSNHAYRISPFSDLTSIETIYIGENVATIPYNMFHCNNTSSCKLTTVYCYATSMVPTLQYQAFGTHTGLTLYVYDEMVESFKNDTQTYNWPSFFSTIEGMGSAPLEEGTYKDLTTGLYFEINEDETTASIYHDELGVYDNNNLVTHSTIANAYTLPERVSADGETYYNVTRVEAEAFANSSISGHLVIPAHITAIGEAAFDSCTGLTEVTFEYSETALLDENAYNNESDHRQSFRDCTGIVTVNLYRHINLGHGGGYLCGPFVWQNSIKTVNIGPRVDEIPAYMFRDHNSAGTQRVIEVINCYALTPPTTSYDPFGDVVEGCVVNVPAGLVDTYAAASYSPSSLTGENATTWGGYFGADNIKDMSNAFAITTHDNGEDSAYATFYNSTSDVELFDDGTETELTAYVAYTLDEETDGLYIEIDAIGNTVPAGTGVIVETEKAGTYLAIATENGESYSGENDLYGYDSAQTIDNPSGDYYYYLLSSVDGQVGFYYGADGGGVFQCQAHRAYLAIPKGEIGDEDGNESNGISIRKGNGGEDTTGISSVENATEGASVKGIYTIQGVRVSNMNQPGLYIVDGKKVLVK